MAITDIQQAAQFSAKAAVSAAEAKQYSLDVQSVSQSVNDATQQANDAAANAATSEKNSALYSESASSAEASASSHAENASESAFQAAESASQAAVTLSSTVKQQITFTTGGTLDSTLDRISDGTYLYYWTGTHPKTVPAGSTLDGTGGVTVGAWACDTYLPLQQHLNSTAGQLVIGSPENNSALSALSPAHGALITTLGALSAYDGGHDRWEFDSTDMSTMVATYPNLFVPLDSDPTGASGAWKQSFSITGWRTTAFGVGTIGDKYHNTAVLNQLMHLNAGIQYIQLAPTVIEVTALAYNGNPKLVGISGVNSDLASFHVMGSLNNGTAIVSRDVDSTDPVLWIYGTTSSRLSGVDIIDLAIISGDLIDNRDLTINPEWQVRSTRIGLRLDYIASKVNISNVSVFGFEREHYFNEVWDGEIANSAIGIGSNSDGTVPAIWLGSLSTDNTNNLTYYNCRIEHCPWSLQLSAVNHVRFIGCKFETKRKFNATNYVIKIDSTAISYGFYSGCMFVTTPTTLTHFLYDQGQRGIYNALHMTGGGINGNYPGILWVNRNPTGTSDVIFTDIKITMANQADGSDPSKYPIILADYDTFDDCSVRTEDVYNILNSDGTYTAVYPSNEGLISTGYGTKLGKINFATNNNTKTAGAIIYARSSNFSLGQFSFSGASSHLLTAANSSNLLDNTVLVSSSGGDLLAYQKTTLIMASTSATLTGLTGLVGQEISMFSYGSGSVIQKNSRIITLSGANITMAANTIYKFKFINPTTIVQM
ncbi:tail fiber/spike domain-containing protein [Klebsiella variicola]|uniref:tail fiber/spike domain-containing protein n=1 Tax=Klebsiella variicola TaxID=244366 RepID=UPI002245FC3E|nr:hypothetical protein [Klebsiella variicola]MCW9234181.1 hypothetical protein [Klebsiella variicola]